MQRKSPSPSARKASLLPDTEQTHWRRSLATAIRDVESLARALHLPDDWIEQARAAETQFPVLVPRSFLARMRPGDPDDPLLRQVLPVRGETVETPGYMLDAVDDQAARKAPGILQKYEGRVLLMAAGACAVHCRYCFRRHYPYGDEPKTLAEWEPGVNAIASDSTIHEVILSGGDPLMLTDGRFGDLIDQLDRIEHLRRLRIHTRLPIVLPDRVNSRLVDQLRNSRLQTIMVVHANHPQEIAGDCAESLHVLVRSGIPTLNQSVLLRGINDDAETLADLSMRLIDLGVMPYYLHLLDRVTGTAHFEVPATEAVILVEELRRRLPGYAVPRLVREETGAASKTPVWEPEKRRSPDE